MIIKGKLENSTVKPDFGIISRLETNRIDNILVGNTLVELKDTNTGLPVRILNPSEEDVIVKKGLVLARLEEVVEILPFENKELQYDNACSADQSIRVTNVSVKKELPGHLKELYDKSAENLNLEEENKLYELLCDNSDLFAKSSSDLGKTSVVEHTINTGNAKPIKQAARRPPRTLAGKENEIIQEQIRTGVIRESTSPWASPMVYVMKKDGSVRPCVDYRKLNDSTLKDAYPLPRIDDCLDNFGNAKFFSTLDLQSGYWQISVADEDKPKTAFVTRSGLYEYNTCHLDYVTLHLHFRGAWNWFLGVCNGK